MEPIRALLPRAVTQTTAPAAVVTRTKVDMARAAGRYWSVMRPFG